MARVLQSLGVRRGMVVCGQVSGFKFQVSRPAADVADSTGFLDELSTLGENRIAEFYQDRGFMTSVMSLDGFPLQPATVADLAGSDRNTNARIVRGLLEGEDRGPKRDAVLLNSAAALFVAGKTKSLVEGWDVATGVIDSGKARAKLKELMAVAVR